MEVAVLRHSNSKGSKVETISGYIVGGGACPARSYGRRYPGQALCPPLRLALVSVGADALGGPQLLPRYPGRPMAAPTESNP